MLAAALMLGGLLPLDAHTRAQWPPTGAWRLPVGDPYAIAHDRPDRRGPFFVLRSVEWDGERASHQGADLGSGQAGEPVRAAATGVVVCSEDHGDHGGYGTHVVLAHRLPGGVLAYSVYAHLREASVRVHPGQIVRAGQMLGRVGMTGRATAPHLHFELRSADTPGERWEFARVEDPLAFVEERLPTYRAETTGAVAVLEWAECAALLSPGARADDALTREAWWRMLAAAVKGPPLDPALEAHALRDSLIAARILSPESVEGHAAVAATWREVARDAARARRLGLRSGAGPLRKAAHGEVCEAMFGSSTPGAHTAVLAERTDHPTLAQAVVLLADLAGPAPEPPKPVNRALHRRTPPVSVVRDSTRTTPLPRDSVRSTPLPRDSTRTTPLPRDSTRTTPLPRDSVRSTPLPRDSVRSTPLPRDSVRNVP